MRATAALLLVLAAPPSHATLIPADLFVSDDGLLTRDSETGLEWLDITATQGQSYNSVAAGFGSYVPLGFRFASVSEVSTLYLHAGVTDQDGGFVVENATGGALLLELMGCTINCFPGSARTQQGLAEVEPFSTSTAKGPFVALSGDETLGFSNVLAANIPKSLADPRFGSYLVRPVPEPSTLFFLGIGVAAIARRARAAPAIARRVGRQGSTGGQAPATSAVRTRGRVQPIRAITSSRTVPPRAPPSPRRAAA